MGIDATTAGRLLRDARRRAGLSQRQLASRAGVAQSVISAYESRRRQPSLPTLGRLIEASGHELDLTLTPMSPSGRLQGALGQRVRRHHDEMQTIAAAHGASNLQVFGSVARGDEHPDSDVDVLVDLPPDAGLFTLLRLEGELSRLLGATVMWSRARPCGLSCVQTSSATRGALDDGPVFDAIQPTLALTFEVIRRLRRAQASHCNQIHCT